MRVFVTDGDNRAALAVTRSIGRGGHTIIVGERQSPSLAQASRYCTQKIVYPNPVTQPAAFVDFLAETVRRERIDVLMPIADITTLLITRHRDRFGSCAIPFADADTVERAANKVDIIQTAARLGVAVPRSVVVHSADAIPPGHLEFPLVIKPWRSRLLTENGWESTMVSYAADREGLERDLALRPAHEFPVMLQERIDGPGIGVFACYHDGKPVAMFSHRRLRERPPWGGVSVLSESVALPKVASDYATKLLNEIGWHGVAMVEFKQDSRDGIPKLMEINGRFWGSLQLAIDAGVDFPSLLMQSVTSGTFGAQTPYKVGVKSRWLWGDFDSLLLTFRGGPHGAPNGATAEWMPALLQFAKFWGNGLHYENPRWDDLRPGLFETYDRMKKALKVARVRSNESINGKHVELESAKLRNAPPPLSVRSAKSFEGVGLDAARWNQLLIGNETNSVFQTHQWLSSWADTFRRDYEPYFITVADGQETLGVAPLAWERGTEDRTLRFLSDARADYCDLLIRRDKARVVRAMLTHLRDNDRWATIELINIPAHSRTAAMIREIGRELGLHVLVEDQYLCPTVIIEGREEEAQRLLNKPSLRRKMNLLQRGGRLACRHFSSAAEIEPHLERFFEQHRRRWAPTSTASLFVEPGNCDFYRSMTDRMASEGWLLFSVLELDEEPIAFHFGFNYDGKLLWYKPTFDLRHADSSPGLVMVRFLLEYALSHRLTELDFTVGDEAFKKRFANHQRKTVQLRVFREYHRYILERARRQMATALRVRQASH